VGTQYQGNLSADSGADSVLSVALNGPGDFGSASISISGTFVGTVQFEASGDGSTWDSIEASDLVGDAPVDSASAPGLWQLSVSALTNLRVRCSAFTSGVIAVTINLSTAFF